MEAKQQLISDGVLGEPSVQGDYHVEMCGVRGGNSSTGEKRTLEQLLPQACNEKEESCV